MNQKGAAQRIQIIEEFFYHESKPGNNYQEKKQKNCVD